MSTEQKVIKFKKGILGFEEYDEYLIVEDEESGLFFLQSKVESSIEFVIISPHIFTQPYEPSIRETYFEELGGGANDEFVIYLMVRLSNNVEEITVNLQAPLLMHIERREGVQVIVDGDEYPIRASLAEMIKGGTPC